MKYDPKQFEDTLKRHATTPDSPIEQIIKNLITLCGVSNNPNTTAFLLPDGTRLKWSSSDRHQTHAGLARQASGVEGVGDMGPLYRLLDAGLIRYKPQEGIELSCVPTEKQSKIIADDWNIGWPNQICRIDLLKSGLQQYAADQFLAHIELPTPMHADQIRNFVKKHI